MKVAALGDAHLGRSYLPYTENGVNVHEHDFEQSFEAAVELTLAQEPDLVIWLGDVFDHPRPTYRSFRLAQRALARLREAGVPAILITGNHDTPRLPGTGSPYSVLADTFGASVQVAHRLTYERFEVGDLVVHAVPQMMSNEATLEALAQADRERSLDHTNLLLAHPLVPSVERRYADINEIEVDDRALQADLVLLGHYHSFQAVDRKRGIWYAGSTDTFTFADDPDTPKGIVVLDTDSGDCRHVPLTGQRPLITLESIEALGLSPAEVQDLVLERASSVPEGSVARLYINGVDPEAHRLLDLEAVRAASSAALHLKLEPSYAGVTTHEALPEAQAMPALWDRYLERQDLTGFDRDRLHDLGHEYLVAAVEQAE